MSESVVHFKMPFPLMYVKARLVVETPDGEYSVEVYRGYDTEVEVMVEQESVDLALGTEPTRAFLQPQTMELTFRGRMLATEDEANLGKLWSFTVPEDAVPQGTFLP